MSVWSFPEPLVRDRLVKRYKRFLADTECGLTLHCPNTGAMTGLNAPGSDIAYWPKSGGKTAGRWMLVKAGEYWACLDSQLANSLVKQGLKDVWPDFETFQWRSEVKLDDSRIDFLGADVSSEWWLEVKGVTLALGDGHGAFPDTVSVRAHKHLSRLTQVAQSGRRASVMYVMMHNGISDVGPAAQIDPQYAKLVDQARLAGVTFYQLPTQISLDGIEIGVPELIN